jgi:translation elongation factor EF-G
MKPILILLVFATFVQSAEFVDGSGFFPVVVQVMKNDGVTPMENLSVRLTDLPEYVETEVDPSKHPKAMRAGLGSPVKTDRNGCAVVFENGRWSQSKVDGKSTYTRAFHGTLVVENGKCELFRISLEKWAAENGYKPQANDAPFVVVTLM